MSNRFFAVVGRMPGDDEDTCCIFEAPDKNTACQMFEDSLYENEIRAEQLKLDVMKTYGQLVFFSHVLVSNSPIEML